MPDRLRLLADEERRRPVPQPAVTVDVAPWVARAPAHEEAFRALPEQLDRSTLRRFVELQPATLDGAVRVFVASQVWGYGRVGYGPHRLARALADDELPARAAAAREQLAGGDPIEAFRVLCVEHKVPWVGTSFGTKYLFVADPLGRALILDSIVAGWLDRHAGLRVRRPRDAAGYAAWLAAAEAWSADLGMPADTLELLIVRDGAADSDSREV